MVSDRNTCVTERYCYSMAQHDADEADRDATTDADEADEDDGLGKLFQAP